MEDELGLLALVAVREQVPRPLVLWVDDWSALPRISSLSDALLELNLDFIAGEVHLRMDLPLSRRT